MTHSPRAQLGARLVQLSRDGPFPPSQDAAIGRNHRTAPRGGGDGGRRPGAGASVCVRARAVVPLHRWRRQSGCRVVTTGGPGGFGQRPLQSARMRVRGRHAEVEVYKATSHASCPPPAVTRGGCLSTESFSSNAASTQGPVPTPPCLVAPLSHLLKGFWSDNQAFSRGALSREVYWGVSRGDGRAPQNRRRSGAAEAR